MPTARLDDRAIIAVTGRDARAFLQGLITNDIEKATPALYAALLTPQGKVMFDFIVQADANGFLLDAAAGQAEDLLKRLKIYRLRAAVDLALRPDLAVFAAWSGDAADGMPADPRLPDLGQRWIGACGSEANDIEALAAYHRHRLDLGVPDSADMTGEFVLDANGEELGAVDFRKGCFVGQEVTARMKHKAQPRKRMAPVLVDGRLPAAGAKLIDGAGTEIGTLSGGIDGQAIASIRVDRFAPAASLTAEGRPVRVRPAAYPLPLAIER